MGVTGDVGRLADPVRYSELWFNNASLSLQLKGKWIFSLLNFPVSVDNAG